MINEVQYVMDLLETSQASGSTVEEWLRMLGTCTVEVKEVEGEKGSTQFIKVRIPAKSNNGPTLGIIGQLGGVGAFPSKLGLVSDADGAIVALAAAAKLVTLRAKGYALPGEVIVTTHISPRSPIVPHKPTSFMSAPVDITTMNQYEVDPDMDAILSVDTTKGNWVLNRRGIAITPTVKEGYILRVSDSLLELMRIVTNEPPVVLPITTQDITPYGNGIYHLNSILQPATATTAPVVGVATTSAIPVPGSASGANQIIDLEMAARFCVEVAKTYANRECSFYDEEEFARLTKLYGSMRHLQTLGRSE